MIIESSFIIFHHNLPTEDMEELGEDEDGGLPAHLEVDPQDGSGDS